MTEREGRWQSDLEEALTEAENRLLKLDVPRPLSKAAGATLSRARRGERDLALELVAKMRSELAALDELMKDLYEKCIAAERAEAADHPFGEAWLSRLRRTLSKIDPAEDWTARWMDAWSSAVAARKWHTADTVAAMAKKRSGVLVPVKTLIAVDSELAEERWENGIRLIDKLLENGPVPAVAAVRLLVGKARLCLYRLGNPDAAIVATEAAAEWAATGPQWSRDLVRAVRAETLVELGNLGEASHLVAGVLDESVGVPDLLVVAGDLCEREGDLPGAQDLYDAAVLRFGDRATAGLLYAPQSTRLLWRGAVNAWPSDPERVLSLLARGLTLAEASPAEGPERQPWLYRAQILEQLGHRSQAAAAYHTAARRYDHAGLPALDLYERAHALSPEERRYGWSYAEALRIAATADRATPDTGVLEQARAVLDGALEGAVLDPEHAWVLVTSAMIAWQLGEEDALLLAERSLVLDPSYARGYGFVSLLLRLRGFVEPALAAAEGGYRVDRTDPFVTSQLAYARAEAGDIEGALEVLDAYLSYVDGNVHVVVAKASVELWADRAGAALATLELAQDWGSLRGAMLLAQCYAILEMRDRETEIYRELLAPDAARTVGLAGWATYGLGQYDEAIELLTATDPRSETPLVRMDLGQVLLARGRPQDVESGQVLLLDAVADCTNVAQLLQLFHPDLRLLEGRIPHGQESAVANAVSQVREAVVQRIERLRTSRLEPGTIAHTLAQARTDVGADRQGRALKLYLALAGDPDLPEVRIRMQSLGRDLLDQGDVLLQVSGVAAARSPWRAADRLPRHLDELDGLLRQVDARLALADLADPAAEREPGPDSLERLARCRGEDLVHVAPTFARDLTSLRKLLGGLASATRSGRMPWAGQRTDVQRAVYGALLDPGHAQAVNRPGARHIGAVEITLDGGLAREYEDGRLSEHIASLRDSSPPRRASRSRA